MILSLIHISILGVIIGCTNIIPIFGAIFGVVLCALLVAFVNPLQGVFFVIFGICLQQFESNLIYPRVVGTSVGLSGLWVLFAITVGGGLFGFAGMLLGLPTFSVIYSLPVSYTHLDVYKRQTIGRAIANHPKVLIADEPTGNLDPDKSAEIMELLEKINEVEKTTVVMVTHDSTIVDRFKKRTICLEEGYVVADIMKGGYLKHD